MMRRVEAQQHLGSRSCPRGGEAVVEGSSRRSCRRVGAADRHQAGLQVQCGRYAVHGLDAVTCDRVDVTVQVDESRTHDQARYVDDCRGIGRGEVATDSSDGVLIDENVRDGIRAGTWIDDPAAAQQDHPLSQALGFRGSSSVGTVRAGADCAIGRTRRAEDRSTYVCRAHEQETP